MISYGSSPFTVTPRISKPVFGVVVSTADDASLTIQDQLLRQGDWNQETDRDHSPSHGGGDVYTTERMEMRSFDELHLYLDNIASIFTDSDFLIFASRHAGETGPLLTAHFTGNAGTADYGGQDRQLAQACPNPHATLMAALQVNAPPDYEVAMECTHHGPSQVGAPSMFVELGSGPDQWEDTEAARAIARAILTLDTDTPYRDRTVVGFGGGHYAPRFNRLLTETDWALGHVVADWAITETEGLDGAVIDQCFTQSQATRGIIDGDRPKLADRIEAKGYRLVSETWVRETDSVPLELVEQAEQALCSVEDGLRFGSARGEFQLYKPDQELLAVLNGIDPERTREIFSRHAIAYETIEAGNRVSGRVAVPDQATLEALFTDLSDLLRHRFSTVERHGDELLLIETRFDPELATEHGVPEGPAFGRLADGDSVTVDGREISPEMVHTERQTTYSLDW